MASRLSEFIEAANDIVDVDNLSYGGIIWRTNEIKFLTHEIVVRKVIESCGIKPIVRDDELGPIDYWRGLRDQALGAKGICENFEEMERALAPDGPVASAGHLHEWVWGSAEQLWLASAYQEAVNAASRSINARIQQKSGRKDISESDLVMQVFDIKPPEAGKPRLWMPGDQNDPTWRSLQEGVKFYGVGCFKAIRNPASHKESTNWGEQEAMEYLSSFSVFARWVSESDFHSNS
ncbi:TIGR02391 family protein [Nocardiopsis sp. YSL2]|uniref:TIGR02391 family protein n=1 Tax=Nocardiopsis sp. YSL2 TaxID=2939492 RepID=UPI0026F40B83|nr:TIGR02391 family protein [Nocardiopsis sp. YSL2]